MLPFDQINNSNFEENALELFRFQAAHVQVYSDYLKHLSINVSEINSIQNIPFLPIGFFKSHQVILENAIPQTTFMSSGTTQMQRSKHYVSDLKLYEKSFYQGFEYFYGNVSEYTILALLPSYIESGSSSLIYMVSHFIKTSKHEHSGFVTEEQLISNIELLKNKKVLLIGVSYALLDLAEKGDLDLNNYIIMETGGMKGRRKEWTRDELHSVYKKAFNVENIHSEYGMTELLSQGYSIGNGIFNTPPWLKIMARPYNEPFSNLPPEQTGVLKVIDLANQNSCAFIETADLGKIHQDGSFEILGRIDFEDIRGCNLLIS